MQPQDLFNLVSILSSLAPCVISVAVLFVPKPRKLRVRGALAVLAGWITHVALTIYAYNPAGIAAAAAVGRDSPQMRFDNNTIAVAILAGWLYPAISVALTLAVRGLIRTRLAGRTMP